MSTLELSPSKARKGDMSSCFVEELPDGSSEGPASSILESFRYSRISYGSQRVDTSPQQKLDDFCPAIIACEKCKHPLNHPTERPEGRRASDASISAYFTSWSAIALRSLAWALAHPSISISKKRINMMETQERLRERSSLYPVIAFVFVLTCKTMRYIITFSARIHTATVYVMLECYTKV